MNEAFIGYAKENNYNTPKNEIKGLFYIKSNLNMDWKVPATIVIIIAIISLGVLPFFSTGFSDSLASGFFSAKKFFKDIIPKTYEFEENVILSLSTAELGKLKIGIPTEIDMDLTDTYELTMDSDNVKVKENLVLSNFTGSVDFSNFSISGSALKISVENFEIERKSKIRTTDRNFNKLRITNLQLAELTVNKGRMIIKSPQKIEAEIENTITLYEFKGALTYENDTAVLEGSCAKIQTKGFTIGE